MGDKDNIHVIPNPERDAIVAEIEVLRRALPKLAEAMMIFYDALIKEGCDHETAKEYVSRKFLK